MTTPPAQTVPPLVELSGVDHVYPGGTHVLHDVSFQVGHGELVAIVGPSGSGKSTLLNLIGTLDVATSGTVRIEGHDIAVLKERQISALRACSIGFVFQQFFLSGGVSAVDNVANGLLYRGIGRGQRRSRAEAALRRVGLGHRLEHRPHELSGGEKQRVAIARAVVGGPPLLLADEPTGALDTASGAAVVELLRELNETGTTVLVITHDLELATGLPRRIKVRDGRIAEEVVPA
ncbi:ABC transporter ATP-binding protein [Streptomyces sp. NPDC050549]|uniref:ABC transporter ATP-binding protein n=1 Tax=Streptomyces sp. NPDC050549 TaxID=3155406 RepID=UPI00342B2E49